MAINDWEQGDGTQFAGTVARSSIDDEIQDYMQIPLKRLLFKYKRGCLITYGSAATVTIGAGEITCSDQTNHRMRQNTSTVTLTLPANGASGDSLDTGNAAVSTWYYAYAVADAEAATFTGVLSASPSEPTGDDYYALVGAFYNNSSDHVEEESVQTLPVEKPAVKWFTKADATVYEAYTDGFVVTRGISSDSISVFTDGSNPPTTLRVYSTGGSACSVKKGDYWKTTEAVTVYWIPFNI